MTTATQTERRISAQPSSDGQHKNVSSKERFISAAGGGLLAVLGLKRGGLSGAAILGTGAMLVQRAYSGHCPMYEALGVDTAGAEPAPNDYFQRGIHVEESFTINKPAAELFAFWRNLENLPKFTEHLKEVRQTDQKHSHWKHEGVAGFKAEWDAEIVNEEPDSLIAWKTIGQADVHSAGSVRFFQTEDRGTEVRVVMDYLFPAGKAGAMVAKLFGKEPGQQVREDLRKFKQLMESGEIPTTEGQARGKCARNAK